MKQTVIATFEQAAQAARRRVFTGGMAAGVLMIGIGAVALLAPLLLGWSLTAILMIGFAVYGAAQLYAYFETPKEQRGLWTLIGGVALIGFALLALWMTFQTTVGAAIALTLLANTVAFFTVLQGIAQIILYAEMKDLEVPGYGWVLAGGLLNVVVGNLIVIRPITGWMAVSTVWGIYLIVSGVAVLVETLADQRGRRVDA